MERRTGACRTDTELLAAAVSDRDAFALLVERHGRAIHGFVYRRVGAVLAEELAAETFVRAFEARTKWRDEGSGALPWLYGIAANVVHRSRRAERRMLAAYARAAALEPLAFFDEPSEERLDAASFSAALVDALENLNEGDRDILLMHAWEELSYKQIAEALDIPVGTVSSRLSRARARVQAALSALHEEDLAKGANNG